MSRNDKPALCLILTIARESSGIEIQSTSVSRIKEKTMLILTRRAGEALIIGDDVTATVLSVKGSQVRAPTSA